MTTKAVSFSTASVKFLFDAPFDHVHKIIGSQSAIFLTDEQVFAKHKKKFAGYTTIVIPAGEAQKQQSTVDDIIRQLIDAGADRKTWLIGVGGGVVTDITGYVAGIYMRGISFGFIPTTILGMVDAAVGGKNGIDVGLYKNIVGLIRQPAFILYDYSFLKTLPAAEWINGFAEIIKQACIIDAKMFDELSSGSIRTYQKDTIALAKLVQKNVAIKTKVVTQDEFEKADRKLLNFGHTLGHAVENLYNIPHGHAVSIGMGVACKISEQKTGFNSTTKVVQLLKQYGLPPQFAFDAAATFRLMKSDKKQANGIIDYILLHKIGKATIHPIAVDELEYLLTNI